MSSVSDKSSPRAAAAARPTAPSRVTWLGSVSRDVVEPQQLMVSWQRAQRSESVGHVVTRPRQRDDESQRHAGKHDCLKRGLVICLCAQPRPTADTQCRHDYRDDSYRHGCWDKRSSVTECDWSSDGDERGSCRRRDASSVSRRERQRRPDDTSSRRCVADDDCVRPRQSELLHYDIDDQQSTHALTDTPAAVQRQSVESSATSDHHQRPHHQRGQSGSPRKNRLTLSCVMADLSGLLRRVRGLHVGRQSETRV